MFQQPTEYLSTEICPMFESKLKPRTRVWIHHNVYVVNGAVGEDGAQGTCPYLLLSDDHTVILNFFALTVEDSDEPVTRLLETASLQLRSWDVVGRVL